MWLARTASQFLKKTIPAGGLEICGFSLAKAMTRQHKLPLP
jgi:hypothetical protein